MSKIIYLKTAYKTLSKYDQRTQKRVVAAIDKIPQGDIKKIKTYHMPNLFRLRIGKYRALYYLDDEIIVIVKIDTRGDIYD